MKAFYGVFLVFVATSAYSWPRYNNPHLFVDNLETHFESLPSSGEIEQNFVAWPGNHWPHNQGGIAHRWMSGDPQNFSYKLLNARELKELPAHKRAELSPAEKYDIYMGRYDYPTVRREWRDYSPRDTDWFGICHGVAPASLNHPEPMNNTLVNRDGVEIEFYSSDVKALLAYQYAKVWRASTRQLGRRCNEWDWDNIPRRRRRDCGDVNPAAFHLVFTNLIGLRNQTFIADIDPLAEVWNHVPKSYSYDVYEEYETRENATPGTVRVLWIGAVLSYGAAIAPTTRPVIGTEQGYYVDQNHSYLLDIDRNGNIIGGKWLDNRKPDFVWTQNPLKFKGYWEALNRVYVPRTSL